MKGFHFRLEPMLGLRRHHEEALQCLLAESQRVLEEEIVRLESLRADVRDQSRRMAERRGPGVVDVGRLGGDSAYLLVLQRRIEEQERRVAEQSAKVAVDRDAVLQASRDRKALEKVREGLLLNFTREAARKDQKAGEEMASVRHLLRRQEPS